MTYYTFSDGLKPYFLDMNKSEFQNVTLSSNGKKTLNLTCFSNGIPFPEITWYKVKHFLNCILNHFIT